MARMVNWNTEAFQAACFGVTMDRLEVAANIIAQDMKSILAAQLTGMQKITGKNSTRYIPWTEHGPYKIGKYAGKLWTARYKAEMVKSIRVARKKDSTSRDIRIVAGYWGELGSWWALQLEYGRGDWHGGRKSFMRPAMAKAGTVIQTCLESGAGQAKGY